MQVTQQDSLMKMQAWRIASTRREEFLLQWRVIWVQLLANKRKQLCQFQAMEGLPTHG